MFVEGVYAPVRELGKLKTVIDLGALYGEFSFYVQDMVDKIYAIEPLPPAYIELEENCDRFENITPYKFCITNENKDRYIEGLADGGAHTKFDVRKTTTPTYKVEGRTLATFMKENGIEHVDALKIDIENHEKYVFNAEDFHEVAPKIDFIIGEHLGDKNLRKLLESYGFKYEKYSHGSIYRR